MSKIFLFSSCRVWTCALDNKWVTNESVIQSHYIDEMIQYINWFTNRDELKQEELDCFRAKINKDNYKEYRKNFLESETVFIELSSVKISRIDNLFYNLLRNHDSHCKSLHYLKHRAVELFKLLKDKQIVLFSHVNTFSVKEMGFIKNRIILQSLCKYLNKKFNVPVVNPTEFLCKYGEEKCLHKKDGVHDINHFTPFMFNLITEDIIKKINESYKVVLNKIQ